METDILTNSYMALRSKLFRSAMNFLKNEEDAKDALQDTFFNLWRNGGVDAEPEAKNKLFTVLKNICINKLKKTRNISLDTNDIAEPVSEGFQFEDMKTFESVLTSGLTDIQRRIYRLVTNEGMEYEAIAQNLNMSVDAVRMNMSRARKKISANYKQLQK